MSDILIRAEGRAGRITLTRPQALNALTHAMVRGDRRGARRLGDDPAVALVLIDAEGARAFCAGGDIAEIYAQRPTRRLRLGRALLGRRVSDERPDRPLPQALGRADARLRHGRRRRRLGHGSHRIVGETAQVAMPECAIGLVPDIGGTALLARAPGRLGEYLGLTGHRMGPGDAIHAGFADRFVPEARWPALVAALVDVGRPRRDRRLRRAPPPGAARRRRRRIDDAFAAADLAALSARLEASDWGHGVLEAAARQSPLSMACTLELVRAARREPGVEKALPREYRFACRAASDGELLEGIRAAVIDKDRNPRWRDDIGRASGPRRSRRCSRRSADELTCRRP